MSELFRVQQIDHVELFVPDRYEAAKWYERVLGLEIVRAVEPWAQAPGGPLMISSDGGKTMLALFAGRARGSRETAGHHRVAFRVDGATFLTFLRRLKDHPVFSEDGQPVHSLSVVDHDQAFSVYFCDPYGNRYEITSYDYDYIADNLEK
jgi:catechol 2,3-dioxygenase-like lactoylglutathione lyase family enzyme